MNSFTDFMNIGYIFIVPYKHKAENINAASGTLFIFYIDMYIYNIYNDVPFINTHRKIVTMLNVYFLSIGDLLPMKA